MDVVNSSINALNALAGKIAPVVTSAGQAPVEAKSGKKSYDLYSKGRFAWVVDNKDEAKLIVTMKKASRLMIIGNTDKGDQTTWKSWHCSGSCE